MFVALTTKSFGEGRVLVNSLPSHVTSCQQSTSFALSWPWPWPLRWFSPLLGALDYTLVVEGRCLRLFPGESQFLLIFIDCVSLQFVLGRPGSLWIPEPSSTTLAAVCDQAIAVFSLWVGWFSLSCFVQFVILSYQATSNVFLCDHWLAIPVFFANNETTRYFADHVLSSWRLHCCTQ